MAVLNFDQLKRLYGAAVSAQLVDRRDALLLGINSDFVATLRSSPIPGDQLLHDLHALNECGILVDGCNPLYVWLSNAVLLAAGRSETTIFADTLQTVLILQSRPQTSDPSATLDAPPSTEEQLPILPLRSQVLFPSSVIPINFGRASSVRLLEHLAPQDKPHIGVVCQRLPHVENPAYEQLFPVGTVATVLKIIPVRPQRYVAILRGLVRFRSTSLNSREPFLTATIHRIPDAAPAPSDVVSLAWTLRLATRALLDMTRRPPGNAAAVLENVNEPGLLADLVTATLSPFFHTPQQIQQGILNAVDIKTRLELALEMVTIQASMLQKGVRS